MAICNRIYSKGSKSAEVLIYDQIGKDWWTGEGIDAKSFAQALRDLGPVESINLRINSPGGLVFEGMAIYNALKDHPAEVHVHIDGLAASIASIIAMVGDTITMAENAAFMIHEPWGVTVGSAEDMLAEADLLQKLTDIGVSTYAARSGQSPESIRQAMKAETWYTAHEAKAAGFVDAISPNKQLLACAEMPRRFQNMPDWFSSRLSTDSPERAGVIARFLSDKGLAIGPKESSMPKTDTNPEAKPESLSADEARKQARQEMQAECQKYTAKFGAKGAEWFAAGLNWEQACDKHCEALTTERDAALSAKTEAEEKLAALDRGEKTPVDPGKGGGASTYAEIIKARQKKS